VADSVERERAFSAAASHQLRTPLTGLRLLLESELLAPRADPTTVLYEGVAAIDRLDATVDDLLLLTRGRPVDRGSLDLDGLIADLGDRWRPAFARAGRRLHVSVAEAGLPLAIYASRSAVTNIADVLVDNALRHGKGEVTVTGLVGDGHDLGARVALRVTDEGRIDASPVEDHPEPAGWSAGPSRPIGLDLARRLAHAEGGDLVCSSTAPTTFELLLRTV
jgi:signal transduction histidine kinase